MFKNIFKVIWQLQNLLCVSFRRFVYAYVVDCYHLTKSLLVQGSLRIWVFLQNIIGVLQIKLIHVW